MTDPGDFTFGRAELEAAVAKGVLDRNAADNLAEFLIQNRDVSAGDPDEERLGHAPHDIRREAGSTTWRATLAC